MAIAVVVLDDHQDLCTLRQHLAQCSTPLASLQSVGPGETPFDQVEVLNPQLRQQRLQQAMAFWLVPFGFFAGVTFTVMTSLDTFAFAGLWGNRLMGGLLGLIAGFLGSFAASSGVDSSNEDRLRQLRNRSEEGCWLLVVESASGQDIPWKELQRVRPQAVVAL
ncbi:MAG: hypothetical protein TE42_10595 [Candidatus Synechococcus spongiarum SP3]|uniref:Uncharacterized protein n=1 Tax=Candidatus Synechococcus spongiarum SP3 TaxID=1604020 RepID=A0A0G2HIR4_9SYNE|nr:MAG: hypothetical protein TE42_10595 [Candidatus Synechococcus spongiarum SP3]